MIIKKVLVTGSAGFIGFHLIDNLLNNTDFHVVGMDNINDYYDINLKYERLKIHGIIASKSKKNELIKSKKYKNYRLIMTDIADHDFIVKFMKNQNFDFVVNLAAQAGVRHSLNFPRDYIHSNINGFLSILEGCRYSNVKHLVFASTSSVYGLNTKMPLSESQPTQHPISLYSATKKSNEMMAHSYSHLFNIPITGLRFFTVYGPWGRPDMALFLFANAIINEKPIKVFNYGKMIRDFTYVSDIAESIKLLLLKPASSNNSWDSNNPEGDSSSAPYRIFNIGNNNPVKLESYIQSLEKHLKKTAKKNYMEIQPGDVPITHADTKNLEAYINFKPKTSIDLGIKNFVKWYKDYYKI